jgi:DNA polymerase III delta prime subunit
VAALGLHSWRLSQPTGTEDNTPWNCGYNLLLAGPPGSGKTLLARCTPTILPGMTTSEMLEVTNIVWKL